jgi:hypothetical protein
MRTDARASMATTVEKGTDETVATAHQQDGVVTHLQRQIAAGLIQFGRVCREQPFPVKDQVELVAVDVRIPVELSRKAEVGGTRL